jgi:hypothetical protein
MSVDMCPSQREDSRALESAPMSVQMKGSWPYLNGEREREREREREKLSFYLPIAVTGLTKSHIFFFFAVHAKTCLGWVLAGI